MTGQWRYFSIGGTARQRQYDEQRYGRVDEGRILTEKSIEVIELWTRKFVGDRKSSVTEPGYEYF